MLRVTRLHAWWRCVCALLALILASACSPIDNRTTLTIATVNNNDMLRLREFTDEFEAAHPSIRLKWVILEENILRQRVSTDVAIRGGQYDVIMIGAYEVPVWSARGWLASLDELGPNYAADDLIEPMREAASYNGVQYAAPFNGESSMMMYRTDLFRQLGLTMPAHPTWDSVIEAAAALHDPSGGVYGLCLRGKAGWGENMALITAMSNSFGARLFDENWRPQFDTPQWRTTLTTYLRAMQSYGPPGAVGNGFNENLALFTQGQCAMWFDSTAAAPFVSDPETSTVSDRVGFAPPPDQGLGRNAGWLWTWAFAIPATSRKMEAARSFIAWAAGPEYAALVVDRMGWLAAPPGTRRSLYINAEYRRVAPFADMSLSTINAVNMRAPTVEPAPYAGVQYAAIPEWQGIGTEVGQFFAAALAGQISPDQALDEAQAATTRQMADAGYYQ